jgi:hypothetical protein
MFADRSRWPSRPRRRSTFARLLGLRVRIQLRAWKTVFCVCCVLCVAFVTGWSLVQRSPNGCLCVSNCVRSLSLKTRWPRPDLGWSTREKKKIVQWLLVLLIKLGCTLGKKTVRQRELDGLTRQQRKQAERVGEIFCFYVECCLVVKCW